MKRTPSLLVAMLLVPLAIAHAAEPQPPAKPNIIFILADDYGFAEVGANGADHYKTPNIDALAKPLSGPKQKNDVEIIWDNRGK